MKIEEFTDGQKELLKALIQGCNIALYRNGTARLRDSKHNPIRNIRMDMFEKVKEYCERIDGLYYFNQAFLKEMPQQLKR